MQNKIDKIIEEFEKGMKINFCPLKYKVQTRGLTIEEIFKWTSPFLRQSLNQVRKDTINEIDEILPKRMVDDPGRIDTFVLGYNGYLKEIKTKLKSLK